MSHAQLLPLGLRATFSRDRDLRRLYWLTRFAPLAHDHRAALMEIADRIRGKMFGAWSRPGERETIRVLFNLYRGTHVRIHV